LTQIFTLNPCLFAILWATRLTLSTQKYRVGNYSTKDPNPSFPSPRFRVTIRSSSPSGTYAPQIARIAI
jgi:hypothetical protein